MLPFGLSMLWERVDPEAALRARFGFEGADEAQAWISAALAAHWSIADARCVRVVLSDHQAIVWVDGPSGPLIVKIASSEPVFERLGAVADLLDVFARAGIATPPPIRAADGQARRVLANRGRPLSVLVQPVVAGGLLDVDDLGAVRATGAELARLHEVLARATPGALATPARGAGRPLRDRVADALDAIPVGRAPIPHARLRDVVTGLPDLDQPVQLVHGDVRSANVLIRDGRVAGLLDFDEVGLDDRIVDLGRGAVLLATRFHDWGPAAPAARAALVEGYRSVVTLSDAEVAWLDAVMLWVALSMVPDGDDPTGWGAALDAMV